MSAPYRLDCSECGPANVATPDLAIDGTDLIGLGYRPGPELGRALDTLLGAVVDDPSLNRRETLLERAKELLVA